MTRDSDWPKQAQTDDDANGEDLESRVIAALRTVSDPEIPVNIVEFGLVYGRPDVSGSRRAWARRGSGRAVGLKAMDRRAPAMYGMHGGQAHPRPLRKGEGHACHGV